jgi:hypothetical protein
LLKNVFGGKVILIAILGHKKGDVPTFYQNPKSKNTQKRNHEKKIV